tara:strand:- start:480 stop:656 length:177 start_codon:yes stop_codon:yes gene_type:complete
MARNKLRARREDIINNVSREERTWRVFEKDLPINAEAKAEPKPKAKKKAKKTTKSKKK